LFFILSSLIALSLGGYGIHNFSDNKPKLEAQHKLSENNRSNDKSNIDNTKSKEPIKGTITIKPNIPLENSRQTDKTLVFARQKGASQSPNKNDILTSTSKKNPVAKDQTTINADESKEKKEGITDHGTTTISSINHPRDIGDSVQKVIAKTEDKRLTSIDTTGSKLDPSTDTRSVQVVNKKKSDPVSRKIKWGINLSAGTSVITEDAFSFKSSYAAADRQYSVPGSSPGGGPATGGGGTGNPSTYYTYSQSQNEPAFAFKAGVHARKNISKRSSLSAGLGYSYLADRIKIGTNQSPAQSFSALWYYSGSPQKTHTDHFHFIELPLVYNWRVTNNADHFLSLNVGVAPSYLLSTNALVYDTTLGGIYYYNKDLITKFHFNFISGISYQFRNKKNLEFSFGPQFSFDVTKAFKSDLDKRKYILYTGIDARVFFERKKK
jgi:hypothetical protein